MNMGQLLETHLGFCCKKAGIYVKSPVFEGFPEAKIWEMMKQQGFQKMEILLLMAVLVSVLITRLSLAIFTC